MEERRDIQNDKVRGSADVLPVKLVKIINHLNNNHLKSPEMLPRAKIK